MYDMTIADVLAFLKDKGFGISRQTFSTNILPMMLSAGDAIRSPEGATRGRVAISPEGCTNALEYLWARAQGGGQSNGINPGRRHDFNFYLSITGR